MKIEYKILWLDDKIQDFIDDNLVKEIEEHLINEGFNPKIITTSKISDFFEKLNDSYDLILTDYHMKDMNGDKVVEEIRKPERSIYTEILFYTAMADLKDTNKINRVSFLETNGRTSSHEETIIEETKKLIDLTIKKFQHIVAMRGMIMHETSSLDAQILEIVKSAIDKGNIDFNTLASSIYEELLALYKEKTAYVDDCKTKLNFKKLTKDNFVFSAKYKIKTLGQILKTLNIDDFSDDYDTKINNIRNKFAHSVLEKDLVTGREYFKYGDSGITFDENICREIRKDIIKHKKNLDTLEDRLKVS